MSSRYLRDAQRRALSGQIDEGYSLTLQRPRRHYSRADEATGNTCGQKLTAWIRVGHKSIRFNAQVTRWLGVWMDAHLTFKEHHNRCMKKARAAEARLRTLTKTYGVVPESVRAIQVTCVQAVALYGSKLWWDPREVGRRDDLQLLLNRQARSILGALSTTPRGALMRDSWLTPAPVILDSRQQ